ncbi:Crp/Fnr family transcriptional regulator [Kitasatospora sp. NPDC127121]|uniref:Crp/Fnr family transcriptional regulator n=1 Tax=Kitasatospora sp. NPDC127121 TaxID=3345371 RepID=UPI003642FDAD
MSLPPAPPVDNEQPLGRRVRRVPSWVEDLAETLPSHSFFRRIRSDQRSAFGRTSALYRFAPGDILSGFDNRPGERGFAVALIFEGWVTEAVDYPDGTEGTALRGPGDLVGDSVLFNPRNTFLARALTHCTAAIMPASAFRGFLQTYPGSMEVLCGVLTSRLQALQLQYELTGQPASRRVNRLLLDLSFHSYRTDGIRIISGLSQSDLANVLKLSRPAIENQISVLKKAGIISVGRKQIIVIKPEKLGQEYESEIEEEQLDPQLEPTDDRSHIAVLVRGGGLRIILSREFQQAPAGWDRALSHSGSQKQCRMMFGMLMKELEITPVRSGHNFIGEVHGTSIEAVTRILARVTSSIGIN